MGRPWSEETKIANRERRQTRAREEAGLFLGAAVDALVPCDELGFLLESRWVSPDVRRELRGLIPHLQRGTGPRSDERKWFGEAFFREYMERRIAARPGCGVVEVVG